MKSAYFQVFSTFGLLATLIAVGVGCSGGNSDTVTSGVSGASSLASGGSPGGGGKSGTNATGGAPGQGGAPLSIGGNTSANGGTIGAGGVLGNGGTATGASAGTGGSVNNGGNLSAAGGVRATGGTKSTGGNTVAGGNGNTGGVRSAGGSATAGMRQTGGAGATAIGGTGGASATGGSAGTLAAVTIYVAGDSTVSTYTDTSATNDQAGWGQMLPEIFNSKVTVVNRAAGGRTAYWFYLEGAVQNILDAIKPGDYFFIQFGTNDQNTTATFTVNGTTYPRYAAAGTTFKEQLKTYYLDPTKAKGAIPVMVTPPPRNSAYCNGGNGLAAYATAMIELGTAENVAVLDNNAKTFNYLKAICPKPTTAAEETFFKNNDGTIDGTHFQENGARKMAGFIGSAIREINLGLAPYLL
jgi:lysophospholipase L1-like esterase